MNLLLVADLHFTLRQWEWLNSFAGKFFSLLPWRETPHDIKEIKRQLDV
jgi:hypothetical protein